jgi:CrcB protein
MPRIDLRELAAIFVGGALGTLARVELVRAFPAGNASWPWPVFAANVGGAFLLGYCATRLQERLPPTAYRRPFLGTGICGGLTTFSTLQIEALQMIDAGRVGLAAGYLAASVAAGFAAIWLATALVRRVRLV